MAQQLTPFEKSDTIILTKSKHATVCTVSKEDRHESENRENRPDDPGSAAAASLLGGILTKKELFYWLDALIALCTIVFHVVFWRCPKCRKWMGGREDQCPFCGTKLK